MKGKITLIGAGPGDPGLLTLKGAAAIASADVVVFDRLVGPGVLAMIPESAEKIDVGKSGGKHPVPQDEINRILVEKAEQGKNVIRLKGGDSFLFGRGGEELETPAEKNIDFEVIPGVTASIAVPAYAGIPVTHRDYTSSVHIITGHAREGGRLSIDFDSLTKLNGTLVFMMGVGALDMICEGLLEAGMEPEMPAAMIESGTTASQRKLISTISKLPGDARDFGIKPPSVIVVGRVCALSDRFDWYSSLPLMGCRVLVTRPKESRGTLSAKLAALGADVIEFPCVKLSEISPNEALEKALPDIAAYSWLVFTSAYGVQVFLNRLAESGRDIRCLAGRKIAVIGSETAKIFTVRGVFPDYVPDVFDAEHLADGLVGLVGKSEKVLLLRARMGTPALCEKLSAAGINYLDLPLYDTAYTEAAGSETEKLLNGRKINFVTFTSASTVEGFRRSFAGTDFSGLKGICIGNQTNAAARTLGIETVVSEKATIDSMLTLIREMYANGNNE
ncbi:uroporphyrinogen III methyltransferase [Clostridia bacterium]|nr:uroporphyrinogen III methyltransferase [Clostridia bacterium]